MTLEEVRKKHGIARSTLNKKITDEKWTRDLTDTVKSATKAAIQAERAVKAKQQAKQLSDSSEEIGKEIGKELGETSDLDMISDIRVIAAVNVIADRRHRSLAEKITRIAESLHEELDAVSGKPMEIRALIDALNDRGGEEDKDLASEIRKTLSLASRANVLDKLAGAATKAISMEREILGLSDGHSDESDNSPVEIQVNLVGTNAKD
jgi:hypothetical protein